MKFSVSLPLVVTSFSALAAPAGITCDSCCAEGGALMGGRDAYHALWMEWQGLPLLM